MPASRSVAKETLYTPERVTDRRAQCPSASGVLGVLCALSPNSPSDSVTSSGASTLYIYGKSLCLIAITINVDCPTIIHLLPSPAMQIYHKTSHRYAETDSNLTNPDISLLVFEAFEPVLWKSETIFAEK